MSEAFCTVKAQQVLILNLCKIDGKSRTEVEITCNRYTYGLKYIRNTLEITNFDDVAQMKCK